MALRSHRAVCGDVVMGEMEEVKRLLSIESDALQAEIDALRAQLAAARQAWAEIAALFDEGALIRNVSGDGDFKLFAHQSVRIVTALKAMDAALTPTRGGTP